MHKGAKARGKAVFIFTLTLVTSNADISACDPYQDVTDF